MPVHVGAILAERYQLTAELGLGHVGTTYLARDLHTTTDVTVKVLHPWLAADATYVARLRHKADAAAVLAPERLAPVRAMLVASEGPVLVANFVPGVSLAIHLQREGGLALADALAIVREIADGLAALHAGGLTHGNLTPTNVCMTGTSVTLLDIGVPHIAASDASADAAQPRTTDPHYLAPERFADMGDIRSDLYALGIMLYLLLAGRVPFHGDTDRALVQQHATARAPVLSFGVPLRVWQIVERCLKKDPDQRFQTPRDLVRTVTDVIETLDRFVARQRFAVLADEAASSAAPSVGPSAPASPSVLRASPEEGGEDGSSTDTPPVGHDGDAPPGVVAEAATPATAPSSSRRPAVTPPAAGPIPPGGASPHLNAASASPSADRSAALLVPTPTPEPAPLAPVEKRGTVPDDQAPAAPASRRPAPSGHDAGPVSAAPVPAPTTPRGTRGRTAPRASSAALVGICVLAVLGVWWVQARSDSVPAPLQEQEVRRDQPPPATGAVPGQRADPPLPAAPPVSAVPGAPSASVVPGQRAIRPPPAAPPTPAVPEEKPVVHLAVITALPVGCHQDPHASAPIATYFAPGSVQSTAVQIEQPDGTWERTASGCWIRTSPGPVVVVDSPARAACVAAGFRRPPPLVADCVAILEIPVAAASGQGTLRAQGPPRAHCMGNALVATGAALDIQEFPLRNADDAGTVSWTWNRRPRVGAEMMTVTVTCTPGGSTSVSVPAA